MPVAIHPYYYSWQKRLFDGSLSLGLIVILSPLLLAFAGLVWLGSGRPVFFSQRRFGQYKRPFSMYKFRTMYVGAENHQHRYAHLNQAPAPMFKIYRDPRFVGVGRLLSRTGLDELPQLFNILKGDMSFVGPRPLPTNESNKLPISWEFRYLVKPGIFSQWTISHDRHHSLEYWNELERRSVQVGSFSGDFFLIVKTLIDTLVAPLFRKRD